MAVSGYIPARASGYKPEARLTENPESVMGTLAGCRGDLINYASALRGMDPEKCGQMFDSYPFMPVWLKEPGRLARRITDLLDKVQFPDGVSDGTGNGEYKVDES